MTHLLRAALALTTLALLAPSAAIPWSVGLASSSTASGVTVALDADPSGNLPRTVGSIEQCVSTTVGQPVDIDIVIPSPGIPANLGIAAHQFNLFYDPNIVWIDDDTNMLLGQAAPSSVVPITDPKPDKNGLYISWAVDFGPNGIEPAGASETGPGVISRITLLPQSQGLSDLVLGSVIIIDDSSQRIDVDSVQSGTIAVGEPCPGQGPLSTSLPTPTPTATSTATPTTAGATSTPEEPTPTPLAAAATVRPFPEAGASPNAGGGAPWWLIVTGLVVTLGGASLLVGGKLALSHQGRRPAAPVNDWRQRPPDDS